MSICPTGRAPHRKQISRLGFRHLSTNGAKITNCYLLAYLQVAKGRSTLKVVALPLVVLLEKRFNSVASPLRKRF